MKISKICIALIGAVSITTVAFADPAINNKNRDNLVFIEPGVAVEFPGYKATEYFPTTCDEEKSILYFGNGINNGWHNASRSTLTLASAFKERMVNSGKQADHDNYNVASAFALSTRFPWQSTNENPQSTWQFLRDYLKKVVPEAVTLDIAQFFNRNGSSFNNMSPKEIARFETTRRDLFNAALEQSDAGQAFAPAYEIFLELGRKSTLVGHSYGTILSNISYENIDPGLQQGFGVTHAASMDKEVAGSSRFSFPNGNPPYVSIEEDMVVSLFRLGFTSNFRWNVDEFDWSDQTTGDAFGSRQPFISGHGFDDYYMKKQGEAGPSNLDRVPARGISRNRILNNVEAYHDQLTNKPCRGHIFTLDNKTDFLGPNMSGAYLQYPSDENHMSQVGQQRESAMVDWKGSYDSGGEATRVLAWLGPAMRYHGQGYSISSLIYRWGRPIYQAPDIVLGAAIYTDAADDLEYILAVTGNPNVSDQIRVYRKRASAWGLNNELVSTNPDGWQLAGFYDFGGDSDHHSPWFFNNDGSQATLLRREKVDLAFEIKYQTPYCDYANTTDPGNSNYNAVCDTTTTDDYYADQPAGSNSVTVLREYQIDFQSSFTPNGFMSVTRRSFEEGATGLLALDYDNQQGAKGQLLKLREERVLRDRGDVTLPDPADESEGRWLTVGSSILTPPDVLDCRTETGKICRYTATVPFGPLHGGMGLQMFSTDDESFDRHSLHVLGLDIRTNTMVYSKRTPADVFYYLYHNGIKTLLGQADSSMTETIPVWTASRYGYTFSGSNVNYIDDYYDHITQKREESKFKREGRLGQYEQYPSNIHNITVGKVPGNFGMAISGNGDVLVSMDMPDGTTINHHSGAPLSKLDYLLNRDLTGLTVNPISVR